MARPRTDKRPATSKLSVPSRRVRTDAATYEVRPNTGKPLAQIPGKLDDTGCGGVCARPGTGKIAHITIAKER